MNRRLTYIPVVLLALIACVMLSGCCDDCEFPLENYDNKTYATVFEARELNDLFTRYGGGWTGGNGGYAISLPDGRTLWLFGTSFLDTVYSDRARPADAKYVRNCFVITDGNSFETLYNGTPENPRPMIEYEDSSYYYEPLSGQVIGDTLEVICQVCGTSDRILPEYNIQGLDVVRLLFPSFTLIDKKTILETPNTVFGLGLYHDSDYIYILGGSLSSNGQNEYLARTPQGSLYQDWQYKSRYGWYSNPYYLESIISGARFQYSLFSYNNKIYLIAIGEYSNNSLMLAKSNTMQSVSNGDWESTKMLFYFPHEFNDMYVHSAQLIEHLSTEDELVVKYCVFPSKIGNQYLLEADNFRIFFLKIRDWK